MYFAKSKLFNASDFKQKLAKSKQALSVYKKAITEAQSVLETQHKNGISSAEIVQNNSWFMDQILIQAWQAHKHLIDNDTICALIAVGGYGREELHPHSDIDLLILLKKNPNEAAQQFIEEFIRFLWDIGLEVGHSVRTIKDCIKESKLDITVMTNLLEARYITGANDLLPVMDEKLRHNRIWPADKFFNGKYQEQIDRHNSHQDTAFNLEPNLKEGPGGLRDLQTILWVFNRRYGVKNFKELVAQEFITEDEYRMLIRSRNMLWKLRNSLHFLNKRREDRLLFDNQRSLAEQYGYTDNSSHLAVEQLMKRYYRTVKDIIYLNDVLLESYKLKNNKKYFNKKAGKKINQLFQTRHNFIEISHPEVFKEHPHALLELFLIMSQNDIDAIHPDTIRAVRASLPLINHSFRSDPKCKELFLDIFRNNTGLTHATRRMNAYGVLGAYLPAFGAIVGQMQHDLFHVYTVDAHTLMVIRNLRRFAIDKHRDEFPIASETMENLYKPERLYLSALFHDIAKGRGGDHSELGEVDAYHFCVYHEMSEYDAKLVSWLVRNHLYMSHFSQRRDISNPEVVMEFANIVGDQEHLDNLFLLTIADIRGTSPKVWNAWKGQLLKELYISTTRVLRQGMATPIDINEHVESDKSEALNLLKHESIDEKEAQAFWKTLTTDYFIRNEPYYIAWHLKSISQTSALNMPVVSVRFSERLEANMFFVFAPDSNLLLSNVTRAFQQLELNIIEARLDSSTSGFALHSFTAIAPDKDLADDEKFMQALQIRLREIMLSGENTSTQQRSLVSRALKHFPIEASVTFNDHSKHHTVMEVVAQNQSGLLHKVATILLKYKIRLVNAKIATFGERVEDVFFITMRDGSLVTSKTILSALSRDICNALNPKQKKSQNKVITF